MPPTRIPPLSSTDSSTWIGDDYKSLTTLYGLRLALRASASFGNWNRQSIAELFDRLFGPARDADDVELAECFADGPRVYRLAEKEALLRIVLAELEAEAPVASGRLFDNVRLLGEALALGELQQQIVALRVLARIDVLLGNALERIGKLPLPGVARVAAIVLRVPVAAVEDALAADGRLVRSGILKIWDGFGTFQDVLEPVEGLSRAVLSRHDSIESLVSFAVQPAPAPKLSLAHFPHLAEQTDLVLRYLGSLRGDRRRGVNILLHGAPGVGKTELARALAKAAGLRLQDVRAQSGHDDIFNAFQRCSHYQLNQSLFARADDIAIVFDEVEDVLGKKGPLLEDAPIRGKAWTLKTLEENPVPAFWIANSVRGVDPAILRRFHMVVEVPQPPRAVRTGIVTEALQGLPVRSDLVSRLAGDEHLPPAVVAQAVSVVRSAGFEDGELASRHLQRLTGGYLSAQGRIPGLHYPQPERYSLDFVNASENLADLCAGLRSRGRGSLLLYGPPGTGKTAFVHHLAGTLNRPLETKRASEILGSYLGQTEANLARAFRAASAGNAILFLDEADSFLARRENAQRNWEVQQVNELLTQMECFGGILLCATNFVDNLDRAALRRFGATIRFDCLKPAQAGALLRQTLEMLGGTASDELTARRAVVGLDKLTAGDFNAARNRWEMLGRAPALEEFVQTLRELCDLKAERRARPIGFVA